ncbi:PleD family two-component system response regulator [Pedobacter agri]|uniref:response regulator n=1 Tax=Pedobacter agri TaxID=454586 RepID=UPI00292D1931|nr:response regulator [Pedobacter agri]
MKKILIVEDDKSNLDVLTLIFENESHLVKGLSSGKDFLKNVLRFKPDIIFADIMLGDYNGMQLCNSLKSNSQTKSIPYYFMSVGKFEEVSKSFGAAGYISKPYELSDILAVI